MQTGPCGVAEQLKREKFLFLSSAGPYRGQTPADALILLAEHVEALLADEQANWIVEIRKQAGGRAEDRVIRTLRA